MVKSEISFLNPPFDPISFPHGTRTRYHIFHGRDRPWFPPCSAVRSGGDRRKSCGPSPCRQGGGPGVMGSTKASALFFVVIGARYPNFWGLLPLPWQYPWIRGHFRGTHVFFFAILRRTTENDWDVPFNSRMLVWFVRKDLESRGNLIFYNDI
jgi:hypothetical protein